MGNQSNEAFRGSQGGDSREHKCNRKFTAAPSSTLKTEAKHSSETSVNIYQPTARHMPQSISTRILKKKKKTDTNRSHCKHCQRYQYTHGVRFMALFWGRRWHYFNVWSHQNRRRKCGRERPWALHILSLRQHLDIQTSLRYNPTDWSSSMNRFLLWLIFAKLSIPPSWAWWFQSDLILSTSWKQTVPFIFVAKILLFGMIRSFLYLLDSAVYEFSSVSCYFHSFTLKYFSQYPVLKHSHLCAPTTVTGQVSYPYKLKRKIITFWGFWDVTKCSDIGGWLVLLDCLTLRPRDNSSETSKVFQTARCLIIPENKFSSVTAVGPSDPIYIFQFVYF
jgi:hypothetical protein